MKLTRVRRGIAPVVALACTFPFPSSLAQSTDASNGERLAPDAYGTASIVRMSALPSASTEAPSPRVEARDARSRSIADVELDPSAATLLAGGGSGAPVPGVSIQGPALFDNNNTAVPPDPGIAVGFDHIVTVVNRNVSVWTKSSGLRVTDVSLRTFFGAPATPPLGNPRVVWDPLSERFFLVASDIDTKLWIAVTTSSDPSAGWFKTSFVASQGADATAWPEYPFLAVDANAVHVAARMIDLTSNDKSSIFVLDKAPLVAPAPSLGAITAFRGFFFENAIRPCEMHGSAPGTYYVSLESPISIRLRRVQGPGSAPTLTDLGHVTIPSATSPFLVPAWNSSPDLELGITSLGDAVYHRGRITIAQHVTAGATVGIRTYEIDPLAVALVGTSTISDPFRHYYHPGMAVNARGDVVLVFNGSSPTEWASSYASGHLGSSAAGTYSTPAVLKAGEDAYNRLDGLGRNRWGQHNAVAVDPLDPHVYWTFTEYTHSGNRWATWIERLELGSPGDPICAGDGIDLAVSTPCPCGNFGARGHGCASSTAPGGALLDSDGVVAADSVVLHASDMPATSTAFFLASDANAQNGLPFGDGLRCVDGTIVRLGARASAGGNASFPDAIGTTLSAASGRVVGSGDLSYYQVAYRNAAAFCTIDTLNATNGLRVRW